MNRSFTFVACILVASLALAGCSGKSNESTSTTTSAPSVITKTTTLPGTTSQTTVTQISTTTTTRTASPTTGATTSSSPTTTSTTSSSGGGDPEDTMPPTVTGIAATTPTQTGVSISWTANDPDGTVEPIVKSQLQWAVKTGSPVYTSFPFQSGAGAKSQSINGLASCTSYLYRIQAVDNAQTPHYYTSPSNEFVTDAGSPNPPTAAGSSIVFSNILNDRFTVTWTAAGADDMKSYVQYGTTLAYGAKSPDQTGPGSKSFTILGLGANTDYHINVHASNNCATSNTGDSGDKIQHTAILVGVDILTTTGPLSYAPAGQAVSGPVSVTKDVALVFQIFNKDATAQVWQISTKSYTSLSIPPGGSYTMPTSISLGAGQYTMTNPGLPSRTGTINSQ